MQLDFPAHSVVDHYSFLIIFFSSPRINGMTFSDPVTLAVLNDFNAGTSLPPPLTPVIEIDDAEDKTPFNAEREIEKMDIR